MAIGQPSGYGVLGILAVTLSVACTNPSSSSPRQAARPRPAAPAAVPAVHPAVATLTSAESITRALRAWSGTPRRVTDAGWAAAPPDPGLVVVRAALSAGAWAVGSQAFRVTEGMLYLSDTRSIALTADHLGHIGAATSLVAVPPEGFSWAPEALREATLGARAACFHGFREGRCLPGCEEALDYFRRPFFIIPMDEERSQALRARSTELVVDVALKMSVAPIPVFDYCGNAPTFRGGDLVGYRIMDGREVVIDWQVFAPSPLDAGAAPRTQTQP